MRKNDLVWNVFEQNYNTQQIEIVNIFDHSGFMEDAKKALEETNKDAFKEKLISSLAYYFMRRSEHEVMITSWPPYIKKENLVKLNDGFIESKEQYGQEFCCRNIYLAVEKKIDIYEQVRLNWDVFVDYVWSKKGNK